MANVSDSYWYDSSNDEYIIPVVWLGDLSNFSNTTEHGPMVGMSSGYSASYSFKCKQTSEFPAIVPRTQEIKYALGRMGTFYPSSDSISGSKYFRISKIAEGHPWITYFTNGTNYAETNDRGGWTGDDDRIAVCLAMATIDDEQYLGLYFYSSDIGPAGDSWAGWCFCYNENANQAWNEIQQILFIDTPPGKPGYKPTGTRYNHLTKPAVGGRGHGATHKKQTPAYETDTLTNPGAPDESHASIIGAGLITPYKISKTNLGNLSTCLYGNTLGGLITNLAINPLDFIVSLNIFPCEPDVGTFTHVVLGKWVCTDSGLDSLGGNVEAYPLSAQFKVISFGSIDVFENWGNFLDYSNTRIELYLPFIGFVDIDTAEVMNGSITVDYTIDFLTGMCVANVNCNKTVETPDGYTYTQSSQHAYQGNCAISVPLSEMQYGQMIGSLINAGVQGMRGGIAGAGISLMGDFVSGNLSPNGSTKGSISANAGFCSVLYPYIRITRPISAESDSFQEVMGYPSYINSSLGECEDLCICESIDLHSISGATDSEIERIRQMCLEGVHV